MSAYTAIASQTLTSAASSVTFSSIPQDFRDLVLVCSVSVSSNAYIRMRFNGNTTDSNYFQVNMAGPGSGSGLSYSGNQAFIQDAITYDSSLHNLIINIMDYSVTDKHKSSLARSNGAATATVASATRFANTAAVTRIDLVPADVNFLSGNTFSLYGVSA